MTVALVETKWCNGCERDLPLSSFHRARATSDGLQTRCTECRFAYKSPEKQREYDKTHYEKHAPAIRVYYRDRNRRDRLEALMHYSGGDPKCACCGERTVEFLCLDHIAGGGNAHRRAVKASNLAGWLRRRGWPEGFRVLCHNCNFARGAYGQCPHEVERVRLVV